jgi:hypothetical protein
VPVYIGITSRPLHIRLEEHWEERFQEKNKLKAAWLISLKQSPLIVDIGDYPDEASAFSAERATVRDLELNGYFLVNEQHSTSKVDKQTRDLKTAQVVVKVKANLTKSRQEQVKKRLTEIN